MLFYYNLIYYISFLVIINPTPQILGQKSIYDIQKRTVHKQKVIFQLNLQAKQTRQNPNDFKLILQICKLNVQNFKHASTCSDEIFLNKSSLSHSDMGCAVPDVLNYEIKFPFPKRVQDLNLIDQKLLEIRQQFKQSYDEFTDYNYILRKNTVTKNSFEYKINEKIKDVQYTEGEKQLWFGLYQKLRFHHKTVMCRQYLQNMDKIQKQFKPMQNIPQLNRLSEYLMDKTGFRLKPVQGMINQRQFLNALAFRTFCCTQYLRHPNSIQYSPQPDFFHQFAGHIPMFADKQIAEISQRIGLMSLGASDEDIKILGTLYLYIIQFGAVYQLNQQNKRTPKAFGAGIAGSVGEMKHFASTKATFKMLQVQKDAFIDLPLEQLQYTYRVSNSFKQAAQSLINLEKFFSKDFIATICKQTGIIELQKKQS